MLYDILNVLRADIKHSLINVSFVQNDIFSVMKTNKVA